MNIMKVGDLVQWISVKNDLQNYCDSEFGIVLEITQCNNELNKNDNERMALIKFYDEAVWLNINSLQVISEQSKDII